MMKITAEVAPEYEKAFPAKTYADVSIETVRARTFASGRMAPRWEPPDTLPTDGELEAKFRGLVGPVLGGPRCDELVTAIWNFDRQPEARSLIRRCQPVA